MYLPCENIIGKIAQQHVGEGLGESRDGQRGGRTDVGSAKIHHHLPDALEAVLVDGLDGSQNVRVGSKCSVVIFILPQIEKGRAKAIK